MSNPSKLGIFMEYFHVNLVLSAKIRKLYPVDELEKIDTILRQWWEDMKSIREDTWQKEMAVDARTDAELELFLGKG